MTTVTTAIKEDAGKPQLSMLPVQFYYNLPIISEEKNAELYGRMVYVRYALVCLAEYAADSANGTSWERLVNACTSVVDSFDTSYEAACETARTMEFGAKKYSRDNWRAGFADSRLLDAAMRHLTRWISDMDTGCSGLDDESGLDHRGHALFEITALLDQIMARNSGVMRGVNDLIQE